MGDSILDIQTFEQLYRRHFTRLYYFAYDFTGDTEASKDIVSEAFTKLWNRRTSVMKEDADGRQAEKLEGLLFITVRNDCLKHVRKKKYDARYVAYCLASMKEEDDSALTGIDEHLDEIYEELSNMPPRTRFVVEECCLNNRSYKEVAEILQISTNGVKKHIVKAFALLRKHFHVEKK